MSPPARILVYGVYGAGKSALAARLADRLGLPWYPVDDLLWQPGWVEVPVPQQRSRILRQGLRRHRPDQGRRGVREAGQRLLTAAGLLRHPGRRTLA